MKEQPLVSIICLSYNHENFIIECLNGILSQKVNFTFEIIVHDDASKDKSQQIIKEFECKYPYLFNNIYQIENQFSKKEINIWTDITFPKAKGKYIALCEGDDYWTDPYKLQKQIDFLEKNSEYFFIGHESLVKIWNETIVKELTLSKFKNTVEKNEYKSEELLIIEYPFHTSSLIFRNNSELINKSAKILRNVITGDVMLYSILAHYGKAYRLSEIMSVYNIRKSGITNTFSGAKTICNLKKMIKTYKLINKEFNHKFSSVINLLILKNFDKILFNKFRYSSRREYYIDCMTFIFSNKYGKLNFFKKIYRIYHSFIQLKN